MDQTQDSWFEQITALYHDFYGTIVSFSPATLAAAGTALQRAD